MTTSFSAIGRAIGPAIGGPLFSWGVKHNYIITPFWALGAISALAPIASLWLVERSGLRDRADTGKLGISGTKADANVGQNPSEEDLEDFRPLLKSRSGGPRQFERQMRAAVRDKRIAGRSSERKGRVYGL
jgi:hypothetical protein